MRYVDATDSTTGVIAKKPGLVRSIAAGVITGQLAGLIMALVMMVVFTVFLGKGPFYPVQVIGSLVFGNAALQGFNLQAFLVGLVLHQSGASLFWGAAFGVVTYGLDISRGPRLVGLALGTGVLSQLIDVNLLLPVVFQALHGHNIWAEQIPAFWSWAAHLVFGAGLALFSSVHTLSSRGFDYLGAPSERASHGNWN